MSQSIAHVCHLSADASELAKPTDRKLRCRAIGGVAPGARASTRPGSSPGRTCIAAGDGARLFDRCALQSARYTQSPGARWRSVTRIGIIEGVLALATPISENASSLPP